VPHVLFVRDVTLIDGTGAAPRERATVCVEDGRIASIAQGPIDVPDGGEVIEGRGLWVVPGLIDTHVHVSLLGAESLPVFLAAGVTTIRDLGGSLDELAKVRQLLADGVVGPRLLLAGPFIDGDPPTWPTQQAGSNEPEGAAAAVDACLAAGADAIKLYTTLPPESARRCIEHVAGRVPVTGHLGKTLASDAMAAGINGLEHALLTPYNDLAPEELRTAPGEVMATPGFWQKVQSGWLAADLASDRARRWIDLLVARDVSLCPTLTVAPGAGDEPDAEVLARTPHFAERWQLAKSLRPEAGPEAQERARAARAKLQELVGRVQDAGGRVVAGTDTGAIINLVPGFGLHEELSHLAGAGLSNTDVLRAATARAAEALWRSDVGTVEIGKRADLLLLRRNPLDDLGALREIHRVVADGRVFDPETLLAP
jgi:hypothetical protein